MVPSGWEEEDRRTIRFAGAVLLDGPEMVACAVPGFDSGKSGEARLPLV